MTQTVNIPGVGKLNFPDGMSHEDMAAAIQKNFPQLHKSETKAPETKTDFRNPYAYFNPEVQRNVGNTGAGTQPAVGAGETALQVGTGLGSSAIGGLAGLGNMLWNYSPVGYLSHKAGLPEIGSADLVGKIQQAGTYQPKTFLGQVGSQAVSDAFDPSVNSSWLNPLAIPGHIGTTLGDISSEAGAPPLLSTALRMAPEVLAPYAVSKAGEGIRAAEAAKVASRPDPIPTTDQLKVASKIAYDAGKNSGVVVPEKNYSNALSNINKMATDEGLDPTLHPKSTAVMKRLNDAQGKDLTLQQAETLRKIALDAEDDVNSVGKPTADARLAGKIVDSLDNNIDELSTNDQARALWSRAVKSQLLDTMIHRAELKAGANYTQAGMETALRQEFKSLALNPRRMRGFTPEQRAAVEKVARGGPMENTLRTLGKFDPTSGPVSAIASIGTGLATGGILPMVGFIGKRLATRATVNNVDAAREALVGRGIPPEIAQRIIDQANR